MYDFEHEEPSYALILNARNALILRPPRRGESEFRRVGIATFQEPKTELTKLDYSCTITIV